MNKYLGRPCVHQGCYKTVTNKGRCQEHQLPAFQTYRKERLPSDWRLRVETVMRQHDGICYLCGEPGADSIDHIIEGDDHSISNLAPAHQNTPNSEGIRCHRVKTSLMANKAQHAPLKQYGDTLQEKLMKKNITPTTYLIITAGEGTRWGDYLKLPKHMIPILGEPIVHRTQRLLLEKALPQDKIILVVKDAKAQASYLYPNNKDRISVEEAILTPEAGDADKILSSRHLWNKKGRTVVIWGDTYLTDNCLDIITDHFPEYWAAVARWGANPYTGSIGGENFAHIIAHAGQEEYDAALERVISLYKNGKITRNGGWEIYKALNGLPDTDILRFLDDSGSTFNPKLQNAIEVIDGSEDFDAASDYDLWCLNWAQADNKKKQIMKEGRIS